MFKTTFKMLFSTNKNRLFFIASKNFSKRTTKPTSGSDVEADKSKKTLRSNQSNTDSDVKETPRSENTQVSGVLKEIKSVPGNKPPQTEDNVVGRYANTLFTVASINEDLFNVYEDMDYFLELHKKSESFRIFIDNAGLNNNQINDVVSHVSSIAKFSKTTTTFLDLLAKNKRFMYFPVIAKKYMETYKLLSKEEKITIISASSLSNSEKDRVKEALYSNPENEGKTFILEYSVNPAIIGGLQMYSENKFMDLSLSSRIEKLKEEVGKMI